jgi:hypothetical protein
VDVASEDHVIQHIKRLVESESVVPEELPGVNPLLISLHDVVCCEISWEVGRSRGNTSLVT